MRIYQMEKEQVLEHFSCDLINGSAAKSDEVKKTAAHKNIRFLSGIFDLLHSKLYYINLIAAISFVIVFIFSYLNHDWHLLSLAVAAFLLAIVLYFTEGVVLYRYKSSYYNRSVCYRQSIKVIRGGEIIALDPNDLQVGDLLVLETGSVLHCDARIIEGEGLFADEGLVFGSTIPEEKNSAAIHTENLSADKQKNMLWKGSYISEGSAKAVVTALGSNCYVEKTGGRKSRKQRSFFYNKQNNIGNIASYVYIILIALCLLFAILFTKRYVEAFLIMAAMSSLVALNPVSCLMEWTYYRTAEKLYNNGVLVRNIEAFDGMNKEKQVYFDAEELVSERFSYSHTIDINGSEKSTLSYFSLCMGPGYFTDIIQNALARYELSYEKLDNSFPVFRREKDSDGNLFSLFSNDGKSVVVAVGYWKKMLPMIHKMDEELLQQIRELEIHGKFVYLMAADSMDYIPNKLDFSYFEGHMDLASLIVFNTAVRDEARSMINQLRRSSMKAYLISDFSEQFSEYLAASYDMDGHLASPPNKPCYSLPHLKGSALAVNEGASPVDKERAMVILNRNASPQNVIYQVKCMFCGIRRCFNFLAISGVFVVLTVMKLFMSDVGLEKLIYPILLLIPILICPCYFLIETVRNCNRYRRSLILGMFCGSAGFVGALISCDLALFTFGLSALLLSAYLLISGGKKREIGRRDVAMLAILLIVWVIPCVLFGGNWLPAVLLALFPPLGALVLDLFY